MASQDQATAATDQRTPSAATVFVVSDDPAVRDSLRELILAAGLHAELFCSLDAWSDAVPSEMPGGLVLDAAAAMFAASERFARLSSICRNRRVLLLVDRGDVPIAVSAIKLGAADVLEKPSRSERLLDCIQRLAAGAPQAGVRT